MRQLVQSSEIESRRIKLKELSFEEKKAKVEDLRVIDDVFFECLAQDKDVDTEILRTILEDPDLQVVDVVVQSDQRNLYGRSVRLDALCTLGNGTLCNIEVQRSNNDDHLKRARFNASSITVRESKPGTSFKDIKEVYVVYISEFDFLRENKVIYHIDKVIRGSGTKIDDGLHEIFVNTAVNDESDISDLMSCFTKKSVSDPKFPMLSKRVGELKNTEGGVTAMCDIMEKYINEGRREERLNVFFELVQKGDLSSNKAAERLNLSEEEFESEMSKAGYTLKK